MGTEAGAMFNERDMRGIADAVLTAVDNAVDLRAQYAAVDAALGSLQSIDAALRAELENAVSDLVLAAIDRSFQVGLRIGQNPASLLGFVDEGAG